MNEMAMVYLIDDEPCLLRALQRLLQAEGHAVRAFESAEEFLRAHDPSMPGCLVTDLCLPGLDGLSLQRTLDALGCTRAVVLMTAYGDIATSVHAMKEGAVDFLVKPFDDESFLAAVRSALAKDSRDREVLCELKMVRGRLASLTPREHEVLEHVVTGRLNKQIAADLGITEKTIKVHRARAMEKMGVSTLADLVRKTLEVQLGTVIDGKHVEGPGINGTGIKGSGIEGTGTDRRWRQAH
jgi:FixJ family two-component response regulator